MKLTIITACYNSIATLPDAIESVRRQKLPSRVTLEHLIVDGGSTDGSEKLATLSERDRGFYDALNKGIRMATGDVIGICNADDILADDDVLARVADAFEANARDTPLDAIYADVRFARENASVHTATAHTIDALRALPTKRYCSGRFFRTWMFRFATFPAHPSTFVRRDCFEKFGLYSLDYSICADFEMMLRLFVKQGIRTRYLPFCTHVMRSGGISTNGFKSNVAINRQDLQALRAHGIWSCLPLIYLKYMAKIWGFIFTR